VIHKALDALGPADLASLVSNGVPEGRSLDYKEQPPGRTDEAHRDFLADVASFANTLGGHMLFGISEQRANGQATGIPAALVGLSCNIGAEALRLESTIRDGIEPRIHGIRFRAVPAGTPGDVLVC
jgi:predicted HTH transcriptional regulator